MTTGPADLSALRSPSRLSIKKHSAFYLNVPRWLCKQTRQLHKPCLCMVQLKRVDRITLYVKLQLLLRIR